MNTTSLEMKRNLTIAQSYYSAILAKNFDKLENFLHDNVHFVSPFGEIHGRENVILAAARDLGTVLQDINIRSRFAHNNQIMLVYDFVFAEPTGKLRAAVLMEFAHSLISKIELFFDTKAIS